MKTKTKIIIAAVIVIMLVAAAIFAVVFLNKPRQTEEKSSNIVQTNMIYENTNASQGQNKNNVVTSTTNINDNENENTHNANTNANVSSNMTDVSDEPYIPPVNRLTERAENYVNPNHADGGTRADSNAFKNDDAIFAEIDKERISKTASEFIKAFLTYDANSINSGGYVSSFAGMVSPKATGNVERQMNQKWLTPMGNSPEVYSSVENVTVEDVYISHMTYDNTIAARVTIIIEKNQDEPPLQDWYYVNTYEYSYSIYFDNNYLVTDVVKGSGRNIRTYPD